MHTPQPPEHFGALHLFYVFLFLLYCGLPSNKNLGLQASFQSQSLGLAHVAHSVNAGKEEDRKEVGNRVNPE